MWLGLFGKTHFWLCFVLCVCDSFQRQLAWSLCCHVREGVRKYFITHCTLKLPKPIRLLRSEGALRFVSFTSSCTSPTRTFSLPLYFLRQTFAGRNYARLRANYRPIIRSVGPLTGLLNLIHWERQRAISCAGCSLALTTARRVADNLLVDDSIRWFFSSVLQCPIRRPGSRPRPPAAAAAVWK